MKRFFSVLAVAAVMAMVIAVTITPAFAAKPIRFDDCVLGLNEFGECQVTTTPSGNSNLTGHNNPEHSDPAEGGGATQEQLDCVNGPGHVTNTPSDNTNLTCHGR